MVPAGTESYQESLLTTSDYLFGTVRPSSKSCKSDQAVRSIREGSMASRYCLNFTILCGEIGPRLSIIRFHASKSAGGCAFAVCMNHLATATSYELALTAAV